MGTAIVYASREDVRRALQSLSTARNDDQIDRALDSASRAVESTLHRIFYPLTATKYFSWPNGYSASWRLWLDGNELASAATLTVDNGNTTVPASGYYLEPQAYGPPYDRIEINRASTSVLSAGSTDQRAIGVTGVFCGCAVNDVAAGALSAVGINASVTTVNVTDSSQVETGHLIKVDSERMLVANRNLVTTAQTLQTPLTASNADVTVAVTTGTAYFVGEMITLDAERMRIVDISGNNLIVQRAQDGSVLATHTGSTIYAPRALTVVRGAAGTTAATHLASAAVTRHEPPSLVWEYTVALTIVHLGARQSGYQRSTTAGDTVTNRGPTSELADLERRVKAAHGRQARQQAV